MTDDTISEQGGCMCGEIRYEVSSEPYYVAVCSCTFCQKLTASDYNVESMFRPKDFRLLAGETKTYSHLSEGSGMAVHIHFCGDCGTSLFLRPERFPDCVGVFSRSFDDPNWLPRDTDAVGYFFTAEAPRGMVIRAGYDTFPGHALAIDGSANKVTKLAKTIMVGYDLIE